MGHVRLACRVLSSCFTSTQQYGRVSHVLTLPATLCLLCPCTSSFPVGLLELSSAVVFCQPAALRALSSLQTLSVSLIPMHSLAALAQLRQLDSLVLRQAQPVSSSQCLALARCSHLRDLSISSVQWGDIAYLAPLTGLTTLSVQVGMGITH